MAETDVNNIMRKYEKTGILTHVARYAGEYGDFSGVPDYKEGLERIMAANEMFDSLRPVSGIASVTIPRNSLISQPIQKTSTNSVRWVWHQWRHRHRNPN